MSSSLKVGDITIHRIIEQEGAFLPALDVLPGLTPELLAENRSWLAPKAKLKRSHLAQMLRWSFLVPQDLGLPRARCHPRQKLDLPLSSGCENGPWTFGSTQIGLRAN